MATDWAPPAPAECVCVAEGGPWSTPEQEAGAPLERAQSRWRPRGYLSAGGRRWGRRQPRCPANGCARAAGGLAPGAARGPPPLIKASGPGRARAAPEALSVRGGGRRDPRLAGGSGPWPMQSVRARVSQAR